MHQPRVAPKVFQNAKAQRRVCLCAIPKFMITAQSHDPESQTSVMLGCIPGNCNMLWCFVACFISTLVVLAKPDGVQGLLVSAGGNIEPTALSKANWSALPDTVPTLSLVCVYQNVVPVIASNLEVRSASHKSEPSLPGSASRSWSDSARQV